MIRISNFLSQDLVTFIDSPDRDAALTSLIDTLEASGRLKDREAFHQAILEREKIVSTGIGMGVAIPHAKLCDYEDFFIVIGVHKSGIEWGSLDGSPVHLVFMIGGPELMQTEYLQILSRLTTAIKCEEKRKQLLAATSAEQVIQLFAED
jgi:PTS system nitrogen regulatory IIA component